MSRGGETSEDVQAAAEWKETNVQLSAARVISMVGLVTLSAETNRLRGEEEGVEAKTALEPWVFLKEHAASWEPAAMFFLSLSIWNPRLGGAERSIPPIGSANGSASSRRLQTPQRGLGDFIGDSSTGARWLEAAVDGACRETMIQLGILSSSKAGAERRAKEVFERATNEVKYARSFAYLGCCYEHGMGVEGDVLKALELHERGVNAGDAQSMSLMASVYDRGIGVV